MRYKKLLVEFKPFPKRFYRVIKVREDLDLFTLGVVLGSALGAAFEHDFAFQTKKKTFVQENFQILYDESHDYMTNYHLSDLGNTFTYLYDTGNSWEFKVKVYEKVEEIRSRKLGLLMDAKGQGIWEDRKSTLDGYLEGELSPDINRNDKDKKYLFPWNHYVEKLGDFDFTLDITALSERLNDLVHKNLNELEENNVF